MYTKRIFILAFVFIAQTAFAQRDTVTSYLNFNEEKVESKNAIYYTKVYKLKDGDALYKYQKFSKSDHKLLIDGWSREKEGQTREGISLEYNFQGGLDDSGRYENNEKEGVWIGYHLNRTLSYKYTYAKGLLVGKNEDWSDEGKLTGSILLDEKGDGEGQHFFGNGRKNSKGSYRGGQKSGPWVYYYDNAAGSKCFEAEYLADSVTNYRCYTEDGEQVKKKCEYEREAKYPGGDKAFTKYLIKELTNSGFDRYMKGISYYQVVIRFIVDKNGNIVDVVAENGGELKLDKIAISIIKGSGPWEPAIQYNRFVKAYRRQPITFVSY